MIKITLPAALLLATTLNAAEIDKAPAAVAGKAATFVQRFTPKGFKNAQVESGTVTSDIAQTPIPEPPGGAFPTPSELPGPRAMTT